MPRAGAAIVAALDPMRIGRVHQHHAWRDVGAKQLVDQFAIVSSHLCRRKHGLQTLAAKRRDLIERKARASLPGPDREHAGPGRGFEHQIIWRQRAGSCRDPGRPRRRCELLPFDLLVAARGLAGYLRFEALKGTLGQIGRHIACQRCHSMQDQHLRQLERGVGVAHRPAASSITSAEVLGHDGIEHGARNDLTGSKPRGEIAPCGEHQWFGGYGKGKCG